MLEITGILRGSSEAWNHKFNLIGVSLTKPSGTLIAVDDLPLDLNDEGVRVEVSKISILAVGIRQIRTLLDCAAMGYS